MSRPSAAAIALALLAAPSVGSVFAVGAPHGQQTEPLAAALRPACQATFDRCTASHVPVVFTWSAAPPRRKRTTGATPAVPTFARVVGTELTEAAGEPVNLAQ
jgi:hypothetical protein